MTYPIGEQNFRSLRLGGYAYADKTRYIAKMLEMELIGCFQQGINELAAAMDTSYDETCQRLKRNYDGYRFAAKGSDIYNPWSLLNCLSRKEITNYWNMTGMPTLIAETLKGIDADLESSFNCRCRKKNLLGLDLRSADPTALLYQTGYITIKSYEKEYDEFELGIPNREVKEGLMDMLLPYYVKVKRGTVERVVSDLVSCVRKVTHD